MIGPRRIFFMFMVLKATSTALSVGSLFAEGCSGPSASRSVTPSDCADAVSRRYGRTPIMYGRPLPTATNVLPSRPCNDGAGSGGCVPLRSSTSTKYAWTVPKPSRSGEISCTGSGSASSPMR